MELKRLVVTTDFSDESYQAFPYVKSMAQLGAASGVSIRLLNVVEDLLLTSVEFEFGLSLIDSRGLLEHSQQEAQRILQEIKSNYFPGLNVNCQTIRATRSVDQEIIEYLQKEPADLLVIASHGRSGLKHLLLGSVTERLIRQVSCPVLVVPIKEK